MAWFRVVVASDGREQQYTIWKGDHHHTAVYAAQEALHAFAKHGHTQFPHNDGPLTVTVRELAEDGVTAVSRTDKP